MKIRIAGWNMANWSHRAVSEEAWVYLESNISADIMLLQECVPPPSRSNGRLVWRAIGGTRPWGSAIATRRLPLVEIELPRNDYTGALIVAKVSLPDSSTLSMVSMYGQLERGYSITALHRMLSDLTPLFDGEFEEKGRPRVVLGGDLNASVQFDLKQRNNSHRIFFDRLTDFGLVDCQGAFDSDRPRTLRRPGRESKWVNDYIFVSKSLEKSVVSADVIEEPAIFSLSDHNPVVVTLDL